MSPRGNADGYGASRHRLNRDSRPRLTTDLCRPGTVERNRVPRAETPTGVTLYFCPSPVFGGLLSTINVEGLHASFPGLGSAGGAVAEISRAEEEPNDHDNSLRW